LAAFRELTLEYYEGLGVNLDFQGIEEELRELPGKYGAPKGEILLARLEGNDSPIGCVALKPLPELGTETQPCCEMKRLFVKPDARGNKAGFRLAADIVETAKQLGYARLVLDTLPRLKSATKIYEALGFEECEAYYHNPLDDVLYFSKLLVEE